MKKVRPDSLRKGAIVRLQENLKSCGKMSIIEIILTIIEHLLPH